MNPDEALAKRIVPVKGSSKRPRIRIDDSHTKTPRKDSFSLASISKRRWSQSKWKISFTLPVIEAYSLHLWDNFLSSTRRRFLSSVREAVALTLRTKSRWARGNFNGVPAQDVLMSGFVSTKGVCKCLNV